VRVFVRKGDAYATISLIERKYNNGCSICQVKYIFNREKIQ